MKDLVSGRRVGIAGLVASLAVVWSISVLYDFPWLTVLWVCLALSTTAVLIGRASTPSVAQVVIGIEAEPSNGRKKP